MLDIYLLFTSLTFNLDENILKALITTETTNKCNHLTYCKLISPTRDIGLLQINEKYSGVHYLGLLFNNETNLHLAASRLSDYKLKLSSRPYWWLSYNVGVTGFKKIKYPSKHPYVKKTLKHYNNLYKGLK